MGTKRFVAPVVSLLVLSLVFAQRTHSGSELTDTSRLSLPSHVILGERAEPLIAKGGRFGFVASVADGALLAFSLNNGTVLSSFVAGKTAGLPSQVETESLRLIALPCLNDPDQGHAATVSIIDATDPNELSLRSLLVLPPTLHITQTTRALLTRDGRYCVIASSFDRPVLFLFDVDSGEIVSQLALSGAPSEVTLFDQGRRKIIAVSNNVDNGLALIRIERSGDLRLTGTFSVAGVEFDAWNNPAFSPDGTRVYIAATRGDRLFAVNADSGALIDSIEIASPSGITTAGNSDWELIGVTRPSSDTRTGGIELFGYSDGRLERRSTFFPPDQITFSRANRVVFDSKGKTSFVGSASGMLFAFDVASGLLDASRQLGSELRSINLEESARTITALRSTPSGDEIVTIAFEEDGSANSEAAPEITSLEPNRVVQGRRKLSLVVSATNLAQNSVLHVNGTAVEAELIRKGAALKAVLPGSFFTSPAELRVTISTGAATSGEGVLSVVRPDSPIVEKINPNEIFGPEARLTVNVLGSGFRTNSVVFLGERALKTERINSGKLKVEITPEVNPQVGRLSLVVRDLAINDLVSNTVDVEILGPKIESIETKPQKVIAGGDGFRMNIRGRNFREGAIVKVGDELITPGRVNRVNARLLKVLIPKRMVQEARVLPVIVTNTQGGDSAPVNFEALAPVVSAVDPGPLLAGSPGASFHVNGENFRKHSRVSLRTETGEVINIKRSRVKFKSDTRLFVNLPRDFAEILSQPSTLNLVVVNPNSRKGVPSTDFELKVLGPEITEARLLPIDGRDQRERLVITGANFRRGAVVEFIKDGEVVDRKVPVSLEGGRIAVIVRSRFINALGVYQVRVSNPAKVRSGSVTPSRNVE